MELDEVSAKIRTGPPVDDEEDYALPVWAGVLPLGIRMGTPEPDPRLGSGMAVPAYFRNVARLLGATSEKSQAQRPAA
jgi:hypothetical protein